MVSDRYDNLHIRQPENSGRAESADAFTGEDRVDTICGVADKGVSHADTGIDWN